MGTKKRHGFRWCDGEAVGDGGSADTRERAR